MDPHPTFGKSFSPNEAIQDSQTIPAASLLQHRAASILPGDVHHHF
jgi:hypothetical protein